MRRILVCSISAALALACRSDLADSEAPFLRGTITSRAPIVYGGQYGLDSIPAMFVDGVGIWPAAEPCAAQARLSIGRNTQVSRRGVPVDTGQLAIGQRVTVWISGVVLESCPPQASAVRVVLEGAH